MFSAFLSPLFFLCCCLPVHCVRFTYLFWNNSALGLAFRGYSLSQLRGSVSPFICKRAQWGLWAFSFFLSFFLSYGVAMVVPDFLYGVTLSLQQGSFATVWEEQARRLEKIQEDPEFSRALILIGLGRDFARPRQEGSGKPFRSDGASLLVCTDHPSCEVDDERSPVWMCVRRWRHLADFFAHATMCVCMCVCVLHFSLVFFFFPLRISPPPLSSWSERTPWEKNKEKTAGVCMCSNSRAWLVLCIGVCLIGQILRSLRDYAWMFCVGAPFGFLWEIATILFFILLL